MKKNIIIWGTALVLVLVAIYVTKYSNRSGSNTLLPNSSVQNNTSQPSSQGASSDNSKTKGEKAPNFTLTDLNGKKVSLEDFRGKSVYLNFWATWCPPCRNEMPEIEKVYQQYKDKDFVVLAVDLGEDKDTVKKFIEQNKYNFNVLLDSDQTVAQKYNISAIPVSYFIDKEGNVISKRVGALSEQEMQLYVKQLIEK